MSAATRLAKSSRAAQGLPATVEDPGTLARVAVLVKSVERRWRDEYPDVTDADVAAWTAAVDRAARNAS